MPSNSPSPNQDAFSLGRLNTWCSFSTNFYFITSSIFVKNKKIRIKKFAIKKDQVAVFTTTRLYIFYIAKTIVSRRSRLPFPLFYEEYCNRYKKDRNYEDPLLRLSSSINFSIYSSMLSSEYLELPKAAKNNREMMKTKTIQPIHSSVVAITISPPVPSFPHCQLNNP